MASKEPFTKLAKFLLALDRGGGGAMGLRKSKLQAILLGICVGITVALTIIVSHLEHFCDRKTLIKDVAAATPALPVQDFPVQEGNEIGLDLQQYGEQEKLSRTKRDVVAPPLLRPRFISTELGLRKKVLVGIILSDASAAGIQRILRINQTLRHTVDKVIFFANGTSQEVEGANQRLRALGLTGIVPIEINFMNGSKLENEALVSHMALRALKYFRDKFMKHFDYYFLSIDKGYINGPNLMRSLKRISVRTEVLWGIPREDSSNGNAACQLESGFVVGRSVLTLIGNRLSRCWSSSLLRNTHGGNLTRCIEYLVPNVSCRQEIQNQVYKVATSMTLGNMTEGVIFAGPVTIPARILQMHQLFCRARKLEIDKAIHDYNDLIRDLRPKVPEAWRKLTWPIGLSPPVKPKSRFEINRWLYFTTDSICFYDSNTVIKSLGGVEQKDIQNILNVTKGFLEQQSSALSKNSMKSKFQFVSGYKRFSPVRGMEYVLDYKNQATGNHVRVEGLRGLLSSIEIVPVPYTTEGKRILIIVPITNVNVAHVPDFLNYVFRTNSDLRDNTTSIIIALAQSLSIEDRYRGAVLLSSSQASDVRELILSYNNGSHPKLISANTSMADKRRKVGFVVISLRSSTHVRLGILDHFGRRGLVRPSSLIVFFEPNTQLKDEFLNRVRMQTILGSQVFNPIPFVQFPDFSGRKRKTLDNFVEVDKNRGAFNSREFRIISFYYADYVEGRRKLAEKVGQIIHGVNDEKTLVELFVKGTSLHIFRATDPHLTLYDVTGSLGLDNCERNLELCGDTTWGSRSQLAKLVLESGVVE